MEVLKVGTLLQPRGSGDCFLIVTDNCVYQKIYIVKDVKTNLKSFILYSDVDYYTAIVSEAARILYGCKV